MKTISFDFLAKATIGSLSCVYKEERPSKDKYVTFESCLTNQENCLQDFSNAHDTEKLSKLRRKFDNAVKVSSERTQYSWATKIREEEARTYLNLKLCDEGEVSSGDTAAVEALCKVYCSNCAKLPTLESLRPFEKELSEEIKNALTSASTSTSNASATSRKGSSATYAKIKAKFHLASACSTAMERVAKNKSGYALAAKLREYSDAIYWSTSKGTNMKNHTPSSLDWFQPSQVVSLARTFNQLKMVDKVDETSETARRFRELVRNIPGSTGPPATDVAWNGKDIEYKMFVRCSPTLRVWLAQVFTLLYAYFVMVYVWDIHQGCNVTLYPFVYFARHISRHELNISDGFIALLMSVYETPPERKVIVLFEDINRLGVDPVFVSIFIDILRRRPNTELVSLRQFGLNIQRSVEITAKYSKRKQELQKISCHTDAGKSISRDEDYEDDVQAIADETEEIYGLLHDESSGESKVVSEAHSLGKSLLAMFTDSSSSKCMMNELAEMVRKVENEQLTAKDAAKALKKSYLDKELPAELVSKLESLSSVNIVLTRSSVGTGSANTMCSVKRTQDGVVMCQASSGLAALRHNDPKTKALPCIIQEYSINRTVVSRYALAMILLLAFNGKVDSIYMKTLVRMSSSIDMIRICLSAFGDHGVGFHPVDCIGKNLMKVATAEVKRALDLSAALQEKHDAEDAEVAKLNNLDQLRNSIMKAIGRMKWGYHVKLIGDDKSEKLGWDNEGDERKPPAKKKKA